MKFITFIIVGYSAVLSNSVNGLWLKKFFWLNTYASSECLAAKKLGKNTYWEQDDFGLIYIKFCELKQPVVANIYN